MPDGLQGRTVLIARDTGRAGGLKLRLTSLGADVLVAPVTATEPGDEAALDAAVANLGGFDWVVVASVNAVNALVDASKRQAVSLADASLKWAAVGPATASTLAKLEIIASQPPEDHSAVGIVAALAPLATPDALPRILLPQGDLAAPTLADGLRAAGFDVTTVTAYRTRPAVIDPEIAQAWASGTIDAAVVAAPSAARQIAAQMDSQEPVVIVAIGNSTAAAARECGFQHVVVADDSTDESLTETVLKALPDNLKP